MAVVQEAQAPDHDNTMKPLRQSLLFVGLFFIFISHPLSQLFAACPFPAIGNTSLGSYTCAISSNTWAGIDGGSTTNTGVLTLNTSGSSITINACGTLLVGSISLTGTASDRAYISIQDASSVCTATGTADSGKIIPGAPIYITDADSDGYPANTTMYNATAVGRRRLSAMTSTSTDCNDSSASTYTNLTCYPDADGDTFYSTASHSVCSGATCASVGESATVGTDCCDSDANAKPGQTAYFTTTRTTCGGYDYDCSGTEVLDSTGTNATTYACTNPCSGCALNYSVRAGWLTAPPATCGGSGTKYTMSGSYVSGTCYNTACANLATSATAKRGCH